MWLHYVRSEHISQMNLWVCFVLKYHIFVHLENLEMERYINHQDGKRLDGSLHLPDAV